MSVEVLKENCINEDDVIIFGDRTEEDVNKGREAYSVEESRDWNEWVSATATRNYVLKDPLLDWIRTHMLGFVTKNTKYIGGFERIVNRNRDDKSFTEFIMNQGKEFERAVIKLLYKGRRGIDSSMIVDIGGDLNPRSERRVKETIDAMNKGIPVIYSGVLHNPNNKTYGIPDLLVRSDWLRNLVDEPPLSRCVEVQSATLLKDVNDPGTSPRYHYTVVDIKFTTLRLRSNGVHLLNTGSVPAYKSQLYIYNEALAVVQGYRPKQAYLLGRKWKYVCKGENYSGETCFERLGVVDFGSVDREYPELTNKAIEWLKRMRKEGGEWNPYLNPNPVKELYPNMCNSHDFPYHSIKTNIANETKEITSLWRVGTKHRDYAHSNRVYRWTDKECTVDTLGVTGDYTKRILSSILDANRVGSTAKILPKVIQNNDRGWKSTEGILEMYVDFEAVSDIITDFSKMPYTESHSMIFMIGVGYIDPDTSRWNYKEFTTDDLTLEEEYRICTEFKEFVRGEELWHNRKARLVHWAHFEQSTWLKTVERFPEEIRLEYVLQWFDLLKVFKSEPIIVKGCPGGFNLKEITKAMHSYGFIATKYDEESSCTDGSGAMLCAMRACRDAKERGIGMRETPIMKEIVEYNEVDCRVLYEILMYLRANHT